MKSVCNLERYKTASGARRAVAYLRKHGIKAATASKTAGQAIPPNVKYQELFVKLEKEAREQGRGLWK